MNRRGLLGVILAAAAAPAIAMAAGGAPQGAIILWGDGVHDDTPGFQALIDGDRVWLARESRWLQREPGLPVNVPAGHYRAASTLDV